MELNIQMFADGKVVIETDLNTKNFQSGLDRMQNATQKAGSTIKNIVVGLGITKLISYAMNQIKDSIGGAISRIDTFKQYPKVLQNFGVSAEEADKSIKRIDKSVRGLPTSLDQAVEGVQNIFMVTKDLEKAEDIFKAINDSAMVFAQGSSEAVDRFSYAYKQAMASGKVYAQDFNQMNQAIPGIMDKVADSMGISFSELKDGLSEGTISMNEFNDALLKLDTEGIEGMEALEKVAKTSTGGIETSITNAKTAIVRGVTGMIEALNTRFENTRFGSLTEFISQTGETIEKGLNKISKIISGEITAYDFGNEISIMINKMLYYIQQNFPKIFNIGINMILEFARGLFNEKSINLAINNITTLIFTIIETILGKVEDFFNIGIDLIENLAKGLLEKQPELIEQVGKILERIIDLLTDEKFLDKLYQAGGKILVALIKGIILSIPKIIQVIQDLKNKITSEIMDLPNKFIRVGADIIIGLWEGIKSEIGGLKNKFTKAIDGVVDGIKKKLGIASPSKVFKNEIGKQMSAGMGIGFEEGLKDVYRDMQRAIDIEQAKLQASVETGKVFNTLQNTTPIAINIDADVEMDSQKVGRIVTPEITRTIKTGGGV